MAKTRALFESAQNRQQQQTSTTTSSGSNSTTLSPTRTRPPVVPHHHHHQYHNNNNNSNHTMMKPDETPPPSTLSTKIRQSLSANNVSNGRLQFTNGGDHHHHQHRWANQDSVNHNNNKENVILRRGWSKGSPVVTYRNSCGAGDSNAGDSAVIYSNSTTMHASKSATLHNGASTAPPQSTAETLVRPSFLKLKLQQQQQQQHKTSNIVFDTCPGTNECRTFFRKSTAAYRSPTAPAPIIDSATQTDFSSSLRPAPVRHFSPNKFNVIHISLHIYIYIYIRVVK